MERKLSAEFAPLQVAQTDLPVENILHYFQSHPALCPPTTWNTTCRTDTQ